MDTVDKSHLLRNLKTTYTSRSFESLTLSEIPIFLCEYVELRKAYSLVNKDDSYLSLSAMEDPGNPPISQIPQLLEEYQTNGSKFETVFCMSNMSQILYYSVFVEFAYYYSLRQ